MYTPATREVAQERIKDLLRHAEHRRLIKTAVRARKERRRTERRQRRQAQTASRRLTATPAPAEHQIVPAEEPT